MTAALAGVALVVASAGAVSSLTGFGFALVAVPLLTLLLDAKDAVALTNVLALGATTILLVRLWSAVAWPVARRMILAALPGLPVGLAVLVLTSARALTLVIAAVVLATVVLLWRGGRLPGTGRRLDVGAGLACGVLTTSTGTNGPPLVLALVARGLGPDAFRATISAVFAAVGVLGVIAILASGQVSGDLAPALVVGAPAMLVGWWAGWRLHQRLDPARFRPLVLALLATSATVAGVGAITGG